MSSDPVSPDKLAENITEALVSCQVLFPDSAAVPPFFALLMRTLAAMRDDVLSGRAKDILFEPCGKEGPDSVALLNQLSGSLPPDVYFSSYFDNSVLDELSRRFPAADISSFEEKKEAGRPSDGAFCFRHVRRLAELFKTLIPDYTAALAAGHSPEKLRFSRLLPSVSSLSTGRSAFLRLAGGAFAMEIRKKTASREPFSSGRTFRHKDGVFEPVDLESIRKVDEFYGYHAARQTFLEHFGAFSAGKSNLPLLISSLPGLGKTQMTISHTLHYADLTLILPSPEDISVGLEALIRRLAQYPARKFMLFFDDIDASTTDWFYFRANVGGTFSLPSNISITIASNQRFPANISSRGRGFVYPIFDEVRCKEMVADFLLSLGMKDAPDSLAAVIASDYVEEFSQKKFEELSPRTLVRYLGAYRNDPVKRKKMLESSKEDIITEPDAQVFYQENLKLMRSIYGDSILEEFRQEALDHGS